MRVLSVNVTWPPFHEGGYEVGAWRLLRMMEHRHNLQSYELVSLRGADQIAPATEPHTFRLLPLIGSSWIGGKSIPHHDVQKMAADRLEATRLVIETSERIKPDVVMFWQYFGDGGYSVDVLNSLARKSMPIFIYASNMQLPLHRLVPLREILRNATVPRWQSLARAARFWWRRNRSGWDHATASLNWTRVAFCSHYLKRRHIELGYPARSGKVVHWGIDHVLNQESLDARPQPATPIRIVWAGRVCAPKGLHVLIDALLSLPAGAFTLDVYGIIEDAQYWSSLSERIIAGGRAEQIRYGGFLAPDAVRKCFEDYDCFVLTSIWAEPFSVVLLEAMAQGLAIITTLTGGTPEIATHENTIAYDAKQPADLAAKLQTLAQAPARIRELQYAALATANRFRLEAMSDQMYDCLSQAAQRS